MYIKGGQNVDYDIVEIIMLHKLLLATTVSMCVGSRCLGFCAFCIFLLLFLDRSLQVCKSILDNVKLSLVVKIAHILSQGL